VKAGERPRRQLPASRLRGRADPGHALPGADPIASPPGDINSAGEDSATFNRAALLTADDVADILQVKRSTALDYMRRGVIPACKIGRRWYVLRGNLAKHVHALFDA
jgi:excisionase family DNA binding protein